MKSRASQLFRYVLVVAATVLTLYGVGAILNAPSIPMPLGMPPLATGNSVLAPFFGSSSKPTHVRARPVPRTRTTAPTTPAAAPAHPASSRPALVSSPVLPVRGHSTARKVATPAATAALPLFLAVADPACNGCTVTQDDTGTLRATIDGSGSGNDTAYALLDFGGPSGMDGTVVVRDRIALGAGQTPSSDLQVLQVLDSAHRIVYRLVISADTRILRLESPSGGLSADTIDISTGVQIPNDGRSSLLVTVSAAAGGPLVVTANGVRVAQVPVLQGGTAGRQRFLAAGIVAVASSGSTARVALTVTHANVSAGASDTPASSSPSGPPTLSPGPPTSVVTPSAITEPSVTGLPVEGGQLVVEPGTWSDSTATLQIVWQRCSPDGSTCTVIADARENALVLGSDDIGSAIRVRITATNSAGSSSAFSGLTDPVVNAAGPAPAVVSAPTIGGTATVGAVLTGNSGTWSDATDFAYAWQRCDATGGNCAPIDGATGSTLLLGDADTGSTIALVVTATGAGGFTSATSATTAVVAAAAPVPAAPTNATPPTVSGDATVGGTLSTSPGEWSDPAAQISYAWQRCDADGTCSPIAGATGSSYATTSEDAGFSISVVVTATNAGGAGSATSQPVTIAAAPPAPPEPPAPVEPPAPDPTDPGAASSETVPAAAPDNGTTSAPS
jgi:hypothetical protein